MIAGADEPATLSGFCQPMAIAMVSEVVPSIQCNLWYAPKWGSCEVDGDDKFGNSCRRERGDAIQGSNGLGSGWNCSADLRGASSTHTRLRKATQVRVGLFPLFPWLGETVWTPQLWVEID